MYLDAKERLENEISQALTNRLLKKAVFSKARNKDVLKTVAVPFEKDGEIFVKTEIFTRDGKAYHKVIDGATAPEYLAEQAFDGYGQINLIGNGKTLELLISEKGKTRFTGSLEGAFAAAFLASQDKEKNYILFPGNDFGFLHALGIATEKGVVHDKKQSKYRQINKFLEQIEAVSDSLPKEGPLCICDLCCGKSYLTFAAYWYFKYKLGRDVEMYGVDLKKDVIEYCTETANRLKWDGIHFECGDVSRFVPPRTPDLVLSLHACDVATDYVLAGAVRSGARVILSTPCCQHELNSQMRSDALSFITEHSMLKQKLAATATDALRAKMLRIYGYKVTVCELIDPEETPKNLIIRAVKTRSSVKTKGLVSEYRAACELLGVTPTLLKLLPLPEDND